MDGPLPGRVLSHGWASAWESTKARLSKSFTSSLQVILQSPGTLLPTAGEQIGIQKLLLGGQ